VLRVGTCSLALLTGLGVALAAGSAPTGRAAVEVTAARLRACPQQGLTRAYAADVRRALLARHDRWGNELLSAPDGPTYERARRYLKPLLLAGAPRKRPLTDSGVYYLPFAQPDGPQGAGAVALHVADGSQVVSERVGGRSLTVWLGAAGRERHGACLARLARARLAGGYLPILQTAYTDATGARYRQESFAARIPQTRSLVSFVRLSVDTRGASSPRAVVRFALSARGLRRSGNRLVRGASTHLVFGAGGSFDGGAVRYVVPRGTTRTLHVAWVAYPAPARPLTLDEPAYEAARSSVEEHWRRRLAEGVTFVVPEQRVLDAQRALLIQNLVLSWRYSIGNQYEQFSFPEGVDVARVMGRYGFRLVDRSIMRVSLTRRATPYPNWKMGQKLMGSAAYYGLYRDRAYVRETTPVLRGYVRALGRQIDRSRTGILQRERYSSDIPESVYGAHSQALAWQGLRAMDHVWEETGQRLLAAECRRLAARLELGLRRAVRSSQRRLPDGSLFVPARLLDGERPYDSVTQARLGSYWNLVMPYAFASGLFRPESPQARGALRYLLRHGSRLLGLVRAGAYALYPAPVFPTSGTNQVYNLNAARFLADLDEPDQLVLSLYGALAVGMTENTFVSGEAASVAPLRGRYHRTMYLPPNAASNAAFLETLRVMLVHERTDAAGRPSGLELGFATPRTWLRPGGRLAVRGAPTSFGPVSYAAEADASAIRVTVEVPARPAPRTLKLRLRLPRGARITEVALDGRPFGRFDARTGTIDLSGRRGTLALVAGYARAGA
jgi:hypothetical protein